MFGKMDILILSVSDIAVSLHFYKNMLGLKQLEEKPDWKSFQLGDSVIAIRPWASDIKDERSIKYGPAFGFNVDNVDKCIKELEKQGAHILLRPQDESWGRYAEIVDPDGYIIMLISELD
jgi:predicted enzyme related to lactoylglutathione lyase